jgi:hypothetical protein
MGMPERINRKYADTPKTENKILTQNVSIGLTDASTGEI